MRLKTLALALAAALLSTTAITAPAHAQIEVDVNRGDVKPLPIAIPVFGGAQGAEIAQVITGDLERSGLFAPINQAAYIEKNPDVNVQPRFADWKTINAQALVNGQATVEGGRLTVNFRLWDVYSEQPLLGLQFTTTPENWRKLAHKISDAIVMTPRFSSTSQEITYMALRPEGSSIYLFNLESGRRETLGNFPGMVFAPRFSPDGGRVAFSVERNGNSDIYVMDLRSRSSSKLTSDPSIETSPSFSPDGTKIVYNSDRGGTAQLYVMDANGGGGRRISFGAGRYTTPVWSPTGDFIAFTKQAGGQFHIGIMRPDGTDERLLTTSYMDEGPTWAPNGRVLMFSRETPGAGPRLWTVDVTGRILRAAPYPGSGSDPAWSPLQN